MIISLVGDSTLGQLRSETINDGDSFSMSLESDGDSSSLEVVRGIKVQFRVWICGLPCSQVKAASLYVIGNLG